MKGSKQHNRKYPAGPPRAGRKLRLACLLAAFGSVLPLRQTGAVPIGASPKSKEYQVKAAFLYNFTKFVEWPPGRFTAPDSPIVIGILGENSFGDELRSIVRNRRVNGRIIVVKAVTTAADAAAIEVLFTPSGEEPRYGAMVAVLDQASVLTVGETQDFATLGGIIDFVLEGDKVRFAVNLESARRARLKLNSQLLNLATAVRK